MRQKAGEIQAYHAYEKAAEKWRKKHMPRKGQGGISEEGQEILEDRDTSTFTTDWFLREGEGREVLGVRENGRS